MTAMFPAGRQLLHSHLLVRHGTDAWFQALTQIIPQPVGPQPFLPCRFPGTIFLGKKILLDLERRFFFLFTSGFRFLVLFLLLFPSLYLKLVHIVQKTRCQFNFLVSNNNSFFSPVQSIADFRNSSG